MSISFAGFSAWFAPELHSYRSTWLKFGGEEKELAEADIAFVTEKTPSGGASYKPTLKILRPDWIEDSVRGQKRLSLKRYKTVFPALRKFDSREYSNMAVGVDAYNSTNTISLESSWQLHQPESVPRSVAVTPGSVRTLALSQSDSEEVDEGEGDDDDDDSEYKEDDELAEEHNQENEPAVAHSRTFARPSRLGRKSMTQEPLLNSNMESIEVLEESDSLVTTSEMPEATTHTAITKKRRLPRSLERSKRCREIK
ncbi:hypothetical protein EC991_001424 [Linnemannia zychae]|nr:hypothetical protein EC991_001424 [Linnemannia zychae]